MAYEVSFTVAAKKDLKKLPYSEQVRIVETCLLLQGRNHILDIKKLQPPFNGFRLRVGVYRVLFEIDKAIITIYAIKHRKDIYR